MIKGSIKEKKILVIGGAGFIGSHFVDRLFVDGAACVTVFDNLSSGRIHWIDKHEGNSKLKFIQGDLINQDSVEEAVQGQDIILYVGGNSDIQAGAKDTTIHLNNNVYGIHNLLEAMRKYDVSEILFTSSSTVYGELENKSENAGPLLPISLCNVSLCQDTKSNFLR